MYRSFDIEANVYHCVIATQFALDAGMYFSLGKGLYATRTLKVGEECLLDGSGKVLVGFNEGNRDWGKHVNEVEWLMMLLMVW
jgi:hypothetical protein